MRSPLAPENAATARLGWNPARSARDDTAPRAHDRPVAPLACGPPVAPREPRSGGAFVLVVLLRVGERDEQAVRGPPEHPVQVAGVVDDDDGVEQAGAEPGRPDVTGAVRVEGGRGEE